MYYTEHPQEPPVEDPQEEVSSRISPFYAGLAFIWEIAKVVIISLLIIIPVRYFLVQPFFVNGASMEESFHDGDYILIDEITYRFNDPVRGDIIVFRYPNDPSQFFVKRVVGLPGERVVIKNNTVTIYNDEHPRGFLLEEGSYLAPHQETRSSVDTKLDPNEYFVLGDNRLHSSDSRAWGPLNRSFITGRVFSRAWPLSKAEFFKDPTY